MHENNHKRKTSIKPEDNPYINNELYPITLVLTSSIMDNYIGQVFKPGTGHFEYDTIPSIEESFEELSKEIQSIGEICGALIQTMNDNNLSSLKLIYDTFNNEYKNVISQKDYLKDHENIINDPAFKKEAFIQYIHKEFYELISDKINKYNSSQQGSFILIDTSELVATHKTKGLIIKDNTTLNHAEINIINGTIKPIFKSVDLQNKNNLYYKPSNILFVEYIHLICGFRNRPFGILFNDTRPSSLFGKYDFYNSGEIRALIDQGIIDEYYKTLDLNDAELKKYIDDDEDDFDDEDDDFED